MEEIQQQSSSENMHQDLEETVAEKDIAAGILKESQQLVLDVVRKICKIIC